MSNTKDKAVELGASLREDLKGFRTELRGLADEIRLKVHLGSMDLKDSWRDVEPKLQEFEARLEKAGVPTEPHEAEGMFHVFPILMPWADASRAVYRGVARFVDARLEAAPHLHPRAVDGIGD